MSVEVPGEVPVKSRIYVIQDGEPTLLMGRQFDKVAFNWNESTIEIGWQHCQSRLQQQEAIRYGGPEPSCR